MGISFCAVAVRRQDLQLIASLTVGTLQYFASAHTLEAAYTGEGGIGKSPPAEATSRMDPAQAMQDFSIHRLTNQLDFVTDPHGTAKALS